MKITSRRLAELLLRVSRNLRKSSGWQHIHAAADANEPRFKAVTMNAFDLGRRRLKMTALKSALHAHDEKMVLSLVSTAISATEKSLLSTLPALMLKTLDQSATGASKRVSLRAAAPSIKGKPFQFDVTNKHASDWAKQHAAEVIDGISQSTREDIHDLVVHSFDDQFDVDDLADQIALALGDDARADTIARTESMRAANEGQQQAWDQAVEAGLLTGNEQQVWIVTPDDRLCPICEPLDGELADLDGTWNADGEDIDGPPAHPNCRCTVGLQLPGT